MTVALCREGFRVNHKRVYRLMKTEKIQSVIRRKRRFFGTKGSIVFENRLHRDFTSNTPLKKLVTDITYIPTTDGFIYLSEELSCILTKDFNIPIKGIRLPSKKKISKAVTHAKATVWTMRKWSRFSLI